METNNIDQQTLFPQKLKDRCNAIFRHFFKCRAYQARQKKKLVIMLVFG